MKESVEALLVRPFDGNTVHTGVTGLVSGLAHLAVATQTEQEVIVVIVNLI